MPYNTTSTNPGVSIEYQNPTTINAVLDGEVVGIDSNTGAQLTREFVVPKESVSGFSADTRMLNLLEQTVIQLKHIRLLLEADQPAELMEDLSAGHRQEMVDDEFEEYGVGIEEE